ncbi:MAG: hypothetical protein Q9M11_03885 [Mariprofundaceae bacterium]|nr:hypothetical protein [Mariprofundaceae bacterium]
MKQHEKGFSIIKMMIWGMIIGALGLYVTAVLPIYNTYWKIQGAFDGAIKNLSTLSEQGLRNRLPELLKTQYLNLESLPEEFRENLEVISNSEGYMKISSSYHITAWFLGQPDAINAESSKGVNLTTKWNHLRSQWKKEFEFKPYAESAHEVP